MKQDD